MSTACPNRGGFRDNLVPVKLAGCLIGATGSRSMSETPIRITAAEIRLETRRLIEYKYIEIKIKV